MSLFSGLKRLASARSVLLTVCLALAMVQASGAVLMVRPGPARATFPDSNGKIVLASNRHGGWEIYTIGYAGHNLKRLTDNSAKNVDPTWSADGKRIAFSNGQKANRTYDIFVMNANGSGKTRVINERKIPDREQGDYAPSFSPNGHQIAFLRCWLRCGDIYKIGTDGSNLKRIVNTDPSYTLLSGPAYSPDGGKIVFSSNRDGDYDLYIMNADGSGKPQRLTNAPHADSAPSWQPIH